jgi:hypothetical protein
MVSAVVVRGFDGHCERFMITGICYGCAPVGAAWSVGVLLVGQVQSGWSNTARAVQKRHTRCPSTAPLASLGQSKVPRR